MSNHKGHHAVSMAAAIAVGTYLTWGSLRCPLLVAVVLFILGISLIGAAIRAIFKARLSPNDFWIGFSEWGIEIEEFWQLLIGKSDRAIAPLEPIFYRNLPEPLRRFLPPVASDPTWIRLTAFWRASKAVFGRRGAGKSFLLAYESWVIKSRWPDAQIYIIDLHLDAESIWFGGDADLIAAHCYKDVEAIAAAVQAVYTELRDRRQQGDRHRPLCKLIIDEIEGVLEEFERLPSLQPEREDARELSAMAERIPSIVAFILDEGRKYNVEASIGAHGGKSKRTGIDSDVLMQMNWLACDDALTFPNTPIVRTIKEAERLEGDRRKIARSSTGRGKEFAGTAILRRVRSEGVDPCVCAVGIPWIEFDLSLIQSEEGQLSEEERWIEQNRERAESLYEKHKSIVRVASLMGINRGRWQYVALKKILISEESTEDV